MNIENRAIDILIASLSPHYDDVSIEGGLIEVDLDREMSSRLTQESWLHFLLNTPFSTEKYSNLNLDIENIRNLHETLSTKMLNRLRFISQYAKKV